MTGLLATFAIGVAGTLLGLIIAHFSSNTENTTTKRMRDLEERERQLSDEMRDLRQRLERQTQASSQETGVLL